MTATAANTRLNVAAMLRSIWPVSTAKQAARLTGMSQRTVEGWIAGRCSPSADTLLAMAEADDRLRAELISILSKGPNPHVPSLEEGHVSVDRRGGSVGGSADGPLLRPNAGQG